MARTTFAGPVRSLRGFLGTGPEMAQSIGAGTTDGGTNIVGIDKYQGKIIQVGDAVTVFNLPSIIDTATPAVAGSDDPTSTNRVGMIYEFVMTASLTSSNTFTLNAGTAAGRSTADVFRGMAIYNNTATDPGAVTAFSAGTSNDTLTLTATTKGGLEGAHIRCRAIDGLLWLVEAQLVGNGAFATPWS
tara:strand:+ start:69 stop:632 length:564 start_codon:yes stop_codon:yes gene_type:complete